MAAAARLQQQALHAARMAARKDGTLDQQYCEAMNWCLGQTPVVKGAKAAAQKKGNGQLRWPLIERSKVDRLVNEELKKRSRAAPAAAAAAAVVVPTTPSRHGAVAAPSTPPNTPPEEPHMVPLPSRNGPAFLGYELHQFAEALRQSAELRGPRNRRKQRNYLRHMLEVRHACTRPGARREGDAPLHEGMVPLNANARQILASTSAPSDKWLCLYQHAPRR